MQLESVVLLSGLGPPKEIWEEPSIPQQSSMVLPPPLARPSLAAPRSVVIAHGKGPLSFSQQVSRDRQFSLMLLVTGGQNATGCSFRETALFDCSSLELWCYKFRGLDLTHTFP